MCPCCCICLVPAGSSCVACFIAREKLRLASRLLCVVTDFSNGKRLTQPPGPQQHEKRKKKKEKKKKKTELRGKWVISKNHWIQNHRALRSREELNDISNKSFPCCIYILMFTRTAWLAARGRLSCRLIVRHIPLVHVRKRKKKKISSPKYLVFGSSHRV